MKFFQTIDLKTTSRIKTPQGFLICVGVKLARPMVKDYYAGELGVVDGFKPSDIIKIYTSPDVLFSQAVIDGFERADVVMTHPKGNQINADNYKEYIIGNAKNVRADDGYLVADLTIKDRWAIEAIEYNDIKQISLGYGASLDLKQGTTNDGEIYQGQWLNMVADHIAVVKDGRCGQDCSIGDKNPTNDGAHMKVKIGHLEFDIGDNATLAQAINNQSAELAKLQEAEIKIGDTAFSFGEYKAMQATIDKLVVDKQALFDENTQLKTNQITPERIEKLVADRTKTIDDAKKIYVDIVVDGKSNEQIKREVVSSKANDKLVQAIVGDVKTCEQKDIDTAFKALIATADNKPNATDIALANLTVSDKKSDDKAFDKSMMWRS